MISVQNSPMASYQLRIKSPNLSAAFLGCFFQPCPPPHSSCTAPRCSSNSSNPSHLRAGGHGTGSSFCLNYLSQVPRGFLPCDTQVLLQDPFLRVAVRCSPHKIAPITLGLRFCTHHSSPSNAIMVCLSPGPNTQTQ